MDCRFADKKLERVERDVTATMGHGNDVDTMFRRRMQLIRAAPDERDFRALKSLHFERLKGRRVHQCSMRLNKQWRLIVEFEQSPGGKVIVIISVEDYH
jgi:proteic killer suppression protein